MKERVIEMVKELYFDIREWDDMYKDRFPKKDLISLDTLLNDYEEALYEIKELEEKIKMLEQDDDNNYDYTDYMNDKICE